MRRFFTTTFGLAGDYKTPPFHSSTRKGRLSDKSLDFYGAKHIFFMLTTHINVECSVNRAGTIDVMVVSPALSTELFIMIDYVGKRFGRLVVLEEAERVYKPSRPSGFRRLKCICDCGNIGIYYINSLGNSTRSCGCLQKEKVTKTGALKDRKILGIHPMYNCWIHILQRCDNIHYHNYGNYGKRGISYDKKRKTFVGFYEDMKEGREKGLTLDRIDNNGNYNKENCRRTTMKVQSRNKRNNVIYKGKCIAEWADLWGMPRSTAREKIKKLLITAN